MITTYEFPNQWKWRIFLAICDNEENINDIGFHLNNKEKCYFNNKIANINTPCFICDPENLIGVVCINNFQLNSKDISICVHELIHLMIYISNISGCEINLNTSSLNQITLSTLKRKKGAKTSSVPKSPSSKKATNITTTRSKSNISISSLKSAHLKSSSSMCSYRTMSKQFNYNNELYNKK